jgi:GxxExxY protein
MVCKNCNARGHNSRTCPLKSEEEESFEEDTIEYEDEIVERDKLKALAEEIVVALGAGHTESIYHNALKVGLQDEGIRFETEKDIPVYFRQQQVGTVRADLILNKKVVVELKSASPTESTVKDTKMQCLKYMSLEGIPYGMIVIFPKKECEKLKIQYLELS